MNVGMLWFDNDPQRALNQKIKRAAAYYWDKYGQKPAVCHLHPQMGTCNLVGEIAVKADITIRPHYFWVGLDE